MGCHQILLDELNRMSVHCNTFATLDQRNIIRNLSLCNCISCIAPTCQRVTWQHLKWLSFPQSEIQRALAFSTYVFVMLACLWKCFCLLMQIPLPRPEANGQILRNNRDTIQPDLPHLYSVELLLLSILLLLLILFAPIFIITINFWSLFMNIIYIYFQMIITTTCYATLHNKQNLSPLICVLLCNQLSMELVIIVFHQY